MKAISGIMLMPLLLGVLFLAFDVQLVEAGGTIYIRADGSIDPPTTLISSVDNITYTFTDSISDEIVIERSNITIDGNGHTLQGSGSGNGFYLYSVRNVTIKKANVKGFECGVYLNSSSYDTLSESNITSNEAFGAELHDSTNSVFTSNNVLSNQYGIYVGSDSPNNTISGNNIANNGYSGVIIMGSDNRIFHNNFINNPYQALLSHPGNVWDNDYPSGGNYWSHYAGVDLYRGLYQNESGSDEIGDTPCLIDTSSSDRDRYPLMSPWPSGPGLHDLEVTLKSPSILPCNTSKLLEATVVNNGVYDENDVNFFLVINSMLVNSTNMPSLEAGASYTLSYLWKPMVEGTYNATTYAMPVLGEKYFGNNRETVFVIVRFPIVLQVPHDYSKIQEAIDTFDLTMPGDTIQVAPGTYFENVVVSKNFLALVGENPGTTIIDGNRTGNVVTINASDVNVDNLTIRNSGDYSAGIYLDSTSNVRIERNVLMSNWRGIYVGSSFRNTIQGNTITNNLVGVSLILSSNNIIQENNITDTSAGVSLYQSSINNTILRNIVSNNVYGVIINWMSDNNTVSGNSITNNSESGLSIDGSSYNVIRNNSIAGSRYNFGVRGGELSNYIQYVEISNTVNGKSIYYLSNQQNITINPLIYPNIGYLALINSHNVTIEGLELRNNEEGILLAYTSNSTIKDNTITNNLWGVLAEGIDNSTFSGNNITANDWNGMTLDSSSGNSVSGNNITNNYNAGIVLGSSSNNILAGNNIAANGADGITLDSSSSNSISGNNITNNYVGIYLLYSSNNEISGNRIRNSYGIYEGELFGVYGSNGNKIYHNNFINCGAFMYAGNTWDDGYPSGGNYWSAYNGVDEKSGPNQDQLGGDGIGDTSYVIWGDNQDRYPFMNSYIPDVTPPTTLNDYDGLWQNASYTIALTATDDLRGIAGTCYRINDGPVQNVTANGQPLITTEGANNKLEYWSVDYAGNEESHHILTGIKLDKTAPAIGTPSRVPDGDILPEQEVKVSVNIADIISEVKNVTLAYTVNDGATWENLPMNYNSSTGLYEATIPQQQPGTLVKYRIVAYDNAQNPTTSDNTGQYYVYTVVPEFTSATILPLLMVLTILAIGARIRMTRRKS